MASIFDRIWPQDEQKASMTSIFDRIWPQDEQMTSDGSDTSSRLTDCCDLMSSVFFDGIFLIVKRGSSAAFLSSLQAAP